MIYHVVIVIIPVEHEVEVVHRFCAGMRLHLCTKDWRVLSHLGSVINKVVIVWYLLRYICQFFCIESSVYYRRHARLLIYGSPSLLDYNYLNLKKKTIDGICRHWIESGTYTCKRVKCMSSASFLMEWSITSTLTP